jgi:hypothetical protein
MKMTHEKLSIINPNRPAMMKEDWVPGHTNEKETARAR